MHVRGHLRAPASRAAGAGWPRAARREAKPTAGAPPGVSAPTTGWAGLPAGVDRPVGAMGAAVWLAAGPAAPAQLSVAAVAAVARAWLGLRPRETAAVLSGDPGAAQSWDVAAGQRMAQAADGPAGIRRARSWAPQMPSDRPARRVQHPAADAVQYRSSIARPAHQTTRVRPLLQLSVGRANRANSGQRPWVIDAARVAAAEKAAADAFGSIAATPYSRLCGRCETDLGFEHPPASERWVKHSKFPSPSM